MKVLAKDAKAGQWYGDKTGRRFLCCDGRRLWTPEGETWNACYDLELTHLPDCTGWDWQPPKPEKKYRPFANAAEYMPHADRWVINDKIPGTRFRVTAFSDSGVTWESRGYDYWHLFQCGAKFADDGTPFGVEVAE